MRNFNTLTTEDFAKFQDASRKIWYKKLLTEYDKQRELVLKELGDNLNTPIFKIIPIEKIWGEWNPQDRTITLNEKLFKYFPWDALVHVLKHEMAHQIVSEVLKKDNYGVAHGEAWKLACKAIQVEPERCANYSYLQDYQVSTDRISEKIQKLFALGESNFEEEANTAVSKAYELMERYKVKLIKNKREGKVWISRPVGGLFTKIPTYVWTLSNILSMYYNVKCIQTYFYDVYEKYKYMEIFGEPHNLDIAEYVFNYLLMESEIQWLKFKASDKYDSSYHGKVQWQRAFMDGFESTLSSKSDNVHKNENKETTALIYQYDLVLEDNYDRQYPNRRSLNVFTTNRRSGSGGFEAGKSTKIKSAIKSGGGSNVLSLNA